MKKKQEENKRDKLWFRAKCYGWGWYPCSWQGWLVIFIWTVLFCSSLILLDHEWLKNLIVIAIITGILIWICYKKGEKPEWRWG
jgi:hypothetical protein